MSTHSINLAMQTEIQMALYRSDIVALIESVFLSMLGLEVHPADSELLSDAHLITGAIYFSGPWKGVALLQCSSSLACEFAARLMGISRPAEFGDDARSALEELTNILGGNLKPLLPRGVELSMPTVTQGRPQEVLGSENNPLMRLVFTSAVGSFGLSVIGL